MRASTYCLFALTFVLLVGIALPVQAAKPLAEVNLELGRTETNRITAPVFDTAQAPSVRFEPLQVDFDTSGLVVRRLVKRVPQNTLPANLDVGQLLTDGLTWEGRSMGLGRAEGDSPDWTVSGRIDDLFLATRPIPFGPILYYTHLHVTLTVEGEGVKETVPLRVHNIIARFNGGMGARDENTEAFNIFMVEASQELIARLNRRFFQAPPNPALEASIAGLSPTLVGERESELRRIGLSGSPEAIQPLLELLRQLPDENHRVHVVEALTWLGAEEAVPVLIERYKEEDEDVRYYTLKLVDALGGDEVEEFLKTRARFDPDRACREFANQLMELHGP
ncbi:MAG: HEAT repeat domain-containing protein [Acidobacteriota bacterium]|nr:HEAT repeat domain-containing protein [Acidobacteriota bacterium]